MFYVRLYESTFLQKLVLLIRLNQIHIFSIKMFHLDG